MNCHHSLEVNYVEVVVTDSQLQSLNRDTHIMLFKLLIMLCFDFLHQANYAHHSVPIMLTITISILQSITFCMSSFQLCYSPPQSTCQPRVCSLFLTYYPSSKHCVGHLCMCVCLLTISVFLTVIYVQSNAIVVHVLLKISHPLSTSKHHVVHFLTHVCMFIDHF